MKIRLENIIPDPDQPRKTFDDEKMTDLQGSMGSLGLIQPITVRPWEDGEYMIVVGERRFRAALLDGAEEIECIVRKDVDDKKAREMQFAENYHVQALPPMEQFRAWQRHMSQYDIKPTDFSRITGVALATVREAVSVLTDLDGKLAEKIVTGNLSVRDAREIARISDPVRQNEVAHPIISGAVAGEKAQEMIRQAKMQPDRPVESIVAHVQERDLSKYRKVLQDEKKQQRQVERVAGHRPSSPDCRVLLGDVSNWGPIGLGAGSVDVVITDPPYNKDFLPTFEHLSAFSAFVLKDGGSLFAMAGQSYLPDVIHLLSSALDYHWTLAYLTPGGQSPQLWDRKVNSFWKPVLWFTKGEYDGKWLGDVVKSEVNDNDKDFHEWGQSESGMADLIKRATGEGDLVLDPFVGGGTTGRVALDLKRKFIGVDNDPESVRLSKQRLGVVD